MRALSLSRRTLAWLDTQVARGRAPSAEDLVSELVEDARARIDRRKALARAIADGRASGISPRSLAAVLARQRTIMPLAGDVAAEIAAGRASGLSPHTLDEILATLAPARRRAVQPGRREAAA
jgi:Arc/MetJ-type ribon-helix-helix transcriptional regulator